MRIVISGGSGFLGSHLADAFSTDGADVVVLTRGGNGRDRGRIRALAWQPDGGAGSWSVALDGADAVVNLAGESIAGRRWSAEHKKQILESRLLATRSLVEAIGRA